MAVIIILMIRMTTVQPKDLYFEYALDGRSKTEGAFYSEASDHPGANSRFEINFNFSIFFFQFLMDDQITTGMILVDCNTILYCIYVYDHCTLELSKNLNVKT